MIQASTEPLSKLNWQTFFRVCTQEMDDLSQRAVKLVIEYCLEVLEEVEKIIRGKATLARLEAALDVQYAEQFENRVFQYRAPSGRKGSNYKGAGQPLPRSLKKVWPNGSLLARDSTQAFHPRRRTLRRWRRPMGGRAPISSQPLKICSFVVS